MSITKDSTRVDETQQVIDRASVDLGTFPLRYSRSGQRWRPATLIAYWTRTRINGDEWDSWRLSATLSGPKVKKDGSDSQLTHDARVFSWGSLEHENDIPAEVVTWIKGSKPTALPEPYRRPVSDDAGAGELEFDLDVV